MNIEIKRLLHPYPIQNKHIGKASELVVEMQLIGDLRRWVNEQSGNMSLTRESTGVMEIDHNVLSLNVLLVIMLKLIIVLSTVVQLTVAVYFSRSQRLQFDVSSPNGILLFREVSKVIVGYGSYISICCHLVSV